MTTGKTIALTRRTFVGKVIFLLFKKLSMLVIAFLPKSKHLLIFFLFYFILLESVLKRWMKLEPIMQSEVSQKEKHQYSILTDIYGI